MGRPAVHGRTYAQLDLGDKVGVQPPFAPHAADAAIGVENKQIYVWPEAEIGPGRHEAIPTCYSYQSMHTPTLIHGNWRDWFGLPAPMIATSTLVFGVPLMMFVSAQRWLQVTCTIERELTRKVLDEDEEDLGGLNEICNPLVIEYKMTRPWTRIPTLGAHRTEFPNCSRLWSMPPRVVSLPVDKHEF